MNNVTIDRDQTDEDILAYDVSDEMLEAAAATGTAGHSTGSGTTLISCC
jgi:hypothetical protein